ncbi:MULTISPECIES: hypothetical protein [unclassified Streptomyces]|uniref:hypothetical protein n=1 Tax=unclassified Streptomyces TaxID=2593676 RepID=UPI00037A7456|nr:MULTISPECIES: hypothetical protein [unclassified Streptomyces]MYQ78408.1 hypothetical protein [Streptomyces sp. SID4923]
MGIESDQLVYDYLSRVGDLAQQQQLPSGARMRLVAELRTEIDRRREAQGAHTPGQVRRIIGALGTPDDLVAAAAKAGAAEPPEPPEIPEPRRASLRGPAARGAAPDAPAPRGAGKDVSPSRRGDPDAPAPRPARKGPFGPRRPKPDADAPVPQQAGPDDSAPYRVGPDDSAPHRLGMDELGADAGDGEWWRDEPGPFGETGPGAFGEFGPGTEVPGFRGGVEIPALLRPPEPEAEEEEEEEHEEDEAPEEEAEAPQEKARRRFRRARPAPAAPEAAPRRGFGHPVLLLAAALLVVGAAMGSLLALAGGWLLAYSSRKLSRAEAKWAAMGLPGVVATAALVWLWGRMDGRWGTPIPEHGMKDALGDVWPVTVRTAAVASALFLLWRSRRR